MGLGDHGSGDRTAGIGVLLSSRLLDVGIYWVGAGHCGW